MGPVRIGCSGHFDVIIFICGIVSDWPGSQGKSLQGLVLTFGFNRGTNRGLTVSDTQAGRAFLRCNLLQRAREQNET